MLLFNLFLTYEGEGSPRPIAEGCSHERAVEILSRHMNLADVSFLTIIPIEYYVPFKEYTL